MEGAYYRSDERNESLSAIKHLGRRLWKRWSSYHRRSLAETAMSRLKRVDERLSAHDPARQVAEVQIRGAILNTFNALVCPTPSLVPDQNRKLLYRHHTNRASPSVFETAVYQKTLI